MFAQRTLATTAMLQHQQQQKPFEQRHRERCLEIFREALYRRGLRQSEIERLATAYEQRMRGDRGWS